MGFDKLKAYLEELEDCFQSVLGGLDVQHNLSADETGLFEKGKDFLIGLKEVVGEEDQVLDNLLLHV